jgi:ABC-2 type transport system permease protein
MKTELQAYASLTLATLRMYLRNPLASFSLVVVLAGLLLGLKVLFGGPAPHTKVTVVQASSTPGAVALFEAIEHVRTFEVTTGSSTSARRALAAGETDMVVVIPPELGTMGPEGSLQAARVSITYRVGGPGENGSQVVSRLVDVANQRLTGRPPLLTAETSALAVRGVQPIDFLLPGLLAFNIVSSALLLAAGVFAGHRTSGVLRRVKAAGVTPAAFVLAHASSSFLLGVAQTVALLGIAALLYSIHVDLMALLVATAAGYLAFLALGFAIAGWIKDAQRASAVATSIGVPMIFIGLFATALPPEISRFTENLPVSYLAGAMRQISEGAGVAALGWDLLGLGAWAVAFLTAAARVFRWESA